MVLTLAAILGAVWLIGILKSVLLPFLVAWLIAYLLEPFVQYNKRLLRVKKRWLPILMTLFESVLVISAISVFIVPSMMDEVHQVAQFVSGYAAAGAQIAFIPDWLHDYLRTNIDFNRISHELTNQDLRTIFDTIGTFITGGYNLVMGIFNWFVVLLYVVFIMLDYERLLKGFKRLVPPKYRTEVYKVEDDIKDSMNRYFRVQVLLALCAAVFYCIGFSIVGIPLAIVLGILVGILYIIPYFQYVTLIPVTAVCYIQSLGGQVEFWPQIGKCILVYVISQCICDYILTPKIMGKVMGLNPAIILLSLSVWGTLLGLIGMIIAIPMTTLMLAYYQQYVINPETAEEPGEKD